MSKKVVTVDKVFVVNKILTIRGMQVMADSDLAEMYQVELKRLNEQVKRNINRFPENFRFQLSEEELEILKSQFAISSGHGGRRTIPHVYHIGAPLEDLAKKWFAFSKMEVDSLVVLKALKDLI